jgi:hypothetical protein
MRKVTPQNQNQNTTVINERSGQNSRDQFELNRTNTRIENELNEPRFTQRQLDTRTQNIQENLNNSNTTLSTNNNTTATDMVPAVNNPQIDGNILVEAAPIIENLAPPPVIIDDLGNRNVQEMLQNLQALRDQAPRAEVNIQRAEQARMGALQVVNDINALMNSYIPYGSFVFWSSLTVAGGYLLYNFNPLRAISWVRRNMRGGVNLIQNTNINPDPNSLSQVHLRNIVQDFNRNPSYYASFVIMMAAIRRFFIR